MVHSMALSSTPNGYLPSRRPRRLSHKAWDTVVRELQARAERLAELPHDNEHARLRLEQVCGAIIDIRREWQRGDM